MVIFICSTLSHRCATKCPHVFTSHRITISARRNFIPIDGIQTLDSKPHVRYFPMPTALLSTARTWTSDQEVPLSPNVSSSWMQRCTKSHDTDLETIMDSVTILTCSSSTRRKVPDL